MNILRASIKAMHIAIEGLEKPPQFLLIDGNRFYPYKDIKYKTIIKATDSFSQLQQHLYWQKHSVMNSWKKFMMSFLNTDGIKIKDIRHFFTGLQ